jgi:hypothetical protein
LRPNEANDLMIKLLERGVYFRKNIQTIKYKVKFK